VRTTASQTQSTTIDPTAETERLQRFTPKATGARDFDGDVPRAPLAGFVLELATGESRDQTEPYPKEKWD